MKLIDSLKWGSKMNWCKSLLSASTRKDRLWWSQLLWIRIWKSWLILLWRNHYNSQWTDNKEKLTLRTSNLLNMLSDYNLMDLHPSRKEVIYLIHSSELREHKAVVKTKRGRLIQITLISTQRRNTEMKYKTMSLAQRKKTLTMKVVRKNSRNVNIRAVWMINILLRKCQLTNTLSRGKQLFFQSSQGASKLVLLFSATRRFSALGCWLCWRCMGSKPWSAMATWTRLRDSNQWRSFNLGRLTSWSLQTWLPEDSTSPMSGLSSTLASPQNPSVSCIVSGAQPELASTVLPLLFAMRKSARTLKS